MLTNIFATPIYVCPVPNHQELKNVYMPYAMKDDCFSTPMGWSCDCDSTIEQEPAQPISWDKFFIAVVPLLYEFLNTLNVNTTGDDIQCQAWMNRYQFGQHQEVHSHHDINHSMISCAYMLSKPKDSGNLIFYNSTPNRLQVVGADTNDYTPEVPEGSIVFFPSTVDHYVSYNKTQDTRVSISANFILHPKQAA